MDDFKLVKCPACKRTLSHYLGGTTSVYRSKCRRCGSTVVIYSAGKTALFKETNISVSATIKIIDNTGKS